MPDVDGQDAEHLLGFVNDAAQAVNAHFVTFLTVGVYIAVTIASTTDEMLVRGSLVTLPLLNVQIPINGVFGFYMAAPFLIVGLHLNLLLQLNVLSRKVDYFEAALAGLNRTQRDRLRDRVANYHFVQFLSGDASGRVGGVLPAFVFLCSMIVLPLVLLSWTQLRFLPVRDSEVTWAHRLALFADVAAIWILLWGPMLRRDARLRGGAPQRGRLPGMVALQRIVALVCASVLILSLLAGRECGLCYEPPLDLRNKVLTARELTPETINALKDGDVQRRETELAKVLQLNVLQGRDLRDADLHAAVLPKLDLRTLTLPSKEKRATRLGGADLTWTQMQGVLLDDTDAHGAKLQGAQLQGASMARALLLGADLEVAQLQGAAIADAQLDWANLSGAKLQGANLENASLVGANLRNADLQGADLRGAQLLGADLSEANLEGADLSDSQLARVILRGARLTGALLCGASLAQANLSGANLDSVDVCHDADDPLAGHAESTRLVCQSSAWLESDYACDVDAYRRVLYDHLGKIACKDAYVARGLSARAEREARAGSASLASALVRGFSRGDCTGMNFVSAQARESLPALSAPEVAATSSGRS